MDAAYGLDGEIVEAVETGFLDGHVHFGIEAIAAHLDQDGNILDVENCMPFDLTRCAIRFCALQKSAGFVRGWCDLDIKAPNPDV